MAMQALWGTLKGSSEAVGAALLDPWQAKVASFPGDASNLMVLAAASTMSDFVLRYDPARLPLCFMLAPPFAETCEPVPGVRARWIQNPWMPDLCPPGVTGAPLSKPLVLLVEWRGVKSWGFAIVGDDGAPAGSDEAVLGLLTKMSQEPAIRVPPPPTPASLDHWRSPG